MPPEQPFVPVAAGPVRLHQRDVARVVQVGGALRGVGVRGVVPPVRAHHRLVGGHPGQRRVPGGAVVQAGLPRVHDRGQPAAPGVAPTGQVALLRDESRVEPAQRGHRRLGGGAAVHQPGGRGVHRRLDDAGGGPGRGAVGAGRVPELRPGEVRPGARGRVEHDVRHPPVDPLRGEQGAQLPPGPVGADVRQADRDERRVPAPLVRVERARGHRVVVFPVGVKGGEREAAQAGVALGVGAYPGGQRHAAARRGRAWASAVAAWRSAATGSPRSRHSSASQPE